MSAIAKKYISLIDFINKIFSYLIALVLGVMSVIIFWQVIARYIIGNSLSWSEELSRFLMIFMIFIGTGLALREGKLIAIEVIFERLSGKVQKYIKIIVHLISMTFYILLIYYGFDLAETFGNQIAPGINISMFYVYLSIPIGSILLFANAIACILDELFEEE